MGVCALSSTLVSVLISSTWLIGLYLYGFIQSPCLNADNLNRSAGPVTGSTARAKPHTFAQRRDNAGFIPSGLVHCGPRYDPPPPSISSLLWRCNCRRPNVRPTSQAMPHQVEALLETLACSRVSCGRARMASSPQIDVRQANTAAGSIPARIHVYTGPRIESRCRLRPSVRRLLPPRTRGCRCFLPAA